MKCDTKLIVFSLALLCLTSPVFGAAAPTRLNPARSERHAETLTPQQEELLKITQKQTLSFLEGVRTDSVQLASCFANTLCNTKIHSQLAEFTDVILNEHRRYRQLVGLYRVDQLKRGHREVSSFLTAVPPVRFSNEEAGQIFKMAAADDKAIRSAVASEFAAKGRTSSELGVYANMRERAEVQVRISALKNDASDFYRLQIENQLNRFPFIAHLETSSPSSEQISVAIQKISAASQERARSISELKGEDLKKLLVYRPVVEAIAASRPDLRKAYEELLQEPERGMFGWPKRAEGLIDNAYLGCVAFYLLAPGWPMGLACTAMVMLSSSGKLLVNFERYQESRVDWLAGLQTFQDVRKNRNQLALSAVTLAVMGYTWYPIGGIIKGSLSAALEQTVVQTARNLVSASALQKAAVGLTKSVIRVKLQVGVGYLLVKDQSERSAQDVLVPVTLGTDAERILVEVGPLFQFADIQRIRRQLPELGLEEQVN